MRGRTNVGGGGALSINGNVEQFKVAEGESVTSGDFVEYSTIKNKNVFSNTGLGKGRKTFQLKDNLVITLMENYLYLLKMIDGKLSIIESYNEKPVYGYCLMQDGRIAILTNKIPYVSIYKIENELFSHMFDVEWGENEIPDFEYIEGVEEYNGELCVISYLDSQHGASQGMYGLRIDWFEKSGENAIIHTGEISKNNNFYVNKSISYFSKGDTFSNGEYFGCTSFYTISLEDYYGSLFKIEGKNIIKVSEYITHGRNPFDGNVPLVFHDKYAIFADRNPDRDGGIYVVNMAAGSYNHIDMKDLGFEPAFDNDQASTVVSKYEDDKLAISYDTGDKNIFQVAVLKVDENTGEVSNLSNVMTIDLTWYAIGIFFLNSTVFPISNNYGSSPSYAYALHYDKNTHQLGDEIDINYVKPYAGGATMGVAKQSGISGEIIEVYVPKSITD